ncbi:hypothetical protein LAZ67_7001497 [Cordylochernes scorpioides]|uniref:Uncharacterized protein n=1 Tax=Cordylochernes scorpioides TaxID=51811 RepID=A0ABY6KMT3_9ARAC|nr:hypothetical protein LAZ67_7001497 [Cordylochernes scorpioides]
MQRAPTRSVHQRHGHQGSHDQDGPDPDCGIGRGRSAKAGTLKHHEKIAGNTVVPISRRYVRVRQSYSNLFKGYTLRCGDFTMEQKLKQRICIEICVKLQISATETFKMPNKAFPNDPSKRTTVFE